MIKDENPNTRRQREALETLATAIVVNHPASKTRKVTERDCPKLRLIQDRLRRLEGKR